MPTTATNTSARRLDRLYSYLSSGRYITGAEALNKFGITNLSRAVQTLQNQGIAVYRTFSKTNGRKVAKYHMSEPAANIVRAGFVAYRLAKTNPVIADALAAATVNGDNARRASRVR
jgi:hypothetical protein